MARRRSARLASATRPRALQAEPIAPPSAPLESVVEREESPVDEPTQSLNAIMSSPAINPRTPSTKSLMKPPMSEMHPSKVHPTMAAPSSALRLGFTDIKPKASNKIGVGALQSTPSKTNAPSSPFTLQHAIPSATDAALGPEAKRMMNDIREEAAKIKAELAAKREQERVEEEQVNARKIARPKGKAGRYSAVHMADFKKMDSIENHPSAFRASKSTPGAAPKKGIKRSQSKANIDDSETPGVNTPAKLPTSKSSKKVHTPTCDPESPAKRTKQGAHDDASTNRPISWDNSNIPRPRTPGKGPRGILLSKSAVANIMSPTQASLARAASIKTPTTSRSLLRSPSKITLTGLKKSATVGDLGSTSEAKEEAPAKLRSPSRFDKVKSMFAKHKSIGSARGPGIPKPTAGMSKTPAPVRAQTELPPAPQTTPGKNSFRSGHFTPAPKHAALAQNSPSPVKSGIPRSKTANNLVNYPSLDSVMSNATADHVSYPDLSGFRPLPEPPTETKSISSMDDEMSEDSDRAPPSVPGTFTFRSDHTIRFGSSSPKGFGANSGQSSVRQVRPSIMPAIPGAFPSTDVPITAAPKGKENMPPYHHQSPFDVKAFPHGVGARKRLRVEDDEEEADREAAERAAKKMKAARVPEGEALVAPRLASAQKPRVRSPSKNLMKTPARSTIKPRAPATTPGGRKVAGISMSRLAYLATPKQRK
ncbi:hypothetical protein J7T55_009538 [Diaporthe amygdali]|uniref:uncharacterized protein n=1 Tax=Phomopsis amygdali TaxID=1214568 RepID=UPI0022FEC5CC|nr:uncharacterized protein J7T55_009538 [Diaporthe amygdali]KAJ0109207.1 hypothetical protein J7T55_009538 [Diaporthe amygdali]